MTIRRIVKGDSLGWPALPVAADAWRSLGKKRVLCYGKISPSMTMRGIGENLPIRVRAKAQVGGNPKRKSVVTKVRLTKKFLRWGKDSNFPCGMHLNPCVLRIIVVIGFDQFLEKV
jgi:hypothetical protein